MSRSHVTFVKTPSQTFKCIVASINLRLKVASTSGVRVHANRARAPHRALAARLAVARLRVAPLYSVSMHDRPGLPLVLCDVSLSVRDSGKVGSVGCIDTSKFMMLLLMLVLLLSRMSSC